jgi:hypothetical protein
MKITTRGHLRFGHRCSTLIAAFSLAMAVPASAAAPFWTKLTNTITGGAGAGTAVLLTDGSVLVHQSCTPNWYKLTPDNTGSYISGTWSAAIPMQSGHNPLYFGSAVLKDGRVVAAGGEYNGAGCTNVDTNLADIYNPATNTWSVLTPPAFSKVGDAPTTVLQNGKLLLGNIFGTNLAQLDPTTLLWTTLAGTGKADNNSEEGWTQLPNGKVLAVDAGTQGGTGSEIYDPVTGTWSSAGSTVASLPNSGGLMIVPELGPQVSRPNGTVFAAGATQHSAVYNIGTGTWSAGPDFPTVGVAQMIADGPASLVPSGNVLVVTSAFFTNTTTGSPGHMFEFDGTSFNSVPGPPNLPNDGSFETRLLLLPTGQVLFTDGSSDIEIYTPAGTFMDAWRPVIVTAPTNVMPGTTYSLTGQQLNGFSEGASYGDDGQMSTNYPLVRIVNNATGHVFYAKTHDHSRMGVEAVGDTSTQTTNFDVPAGIEIGASTLYVVTNGIPTQPSNVMVGTLAPPVISKTFTPASIGLGSVTSLFFTIVNPNPVGGTLTGIGFADTLPSGLATVGSPIGTCDGGTVNVTAGSIGLAGATLAAGASCTFSVEISGVTAGVKNNTTGAVTSNEAGNGNMAAATLAVYAPPSVSKAFAVPSIPLGTSTSLSFTVTNPNVAALTLTGISFADNLPAGLTTGAVNGVCGGGSISTSPTNIALFNATLPGGGTCTFSVIVNGVSPGVMNNVSGTVTSNESFFGNKASATLLVVAPPSITKTFSPVKILPGGLSTVTLQITNPNNFVGLTGVAFTDTLPGALVIATPNGLTSNCGGTATATAGSGTISLTGGSISASNSCTVTAAVTGPEGIYVNSVQVTSTNGGTGNTAQATLYAVTPPNLSKVFGAVSIGVNNTTSLTFTLANPNHVVTLNALTFTDNLPIGIVVATPNGLTGSCGGGTITAVPGSASVALSGATLAPGANCVFSVNVTANGTATGLVTNTTTTVTSTEALPSATASANLFIGDPFQISYAANLADGDSFVDITNAGSSGAGLQSGTTAAITGAICANVYAFTPDEQMVSCCSCPVTPNGLVSLSAVNDLASNTLTPAVPTALVIKVLATLPVAGSCNNSAAAVTTAALGNGVKSFGTTIHSTPVAGIYGVTERPFSAGTLSAGELNRIGNLCNFIIANGSGFGICRSCRLGGLGAVSQ